MHTMFVSHGLVTYVSCAAVFLLMPETKGLTLTELAEIWSGAGDNKESERTVPITATKRVSSISLV